MTRTAEVKLGATRGCIQTQLLTTWVALGKELHFGESQFLHVENENMEGAGR